MGNFGQERKGFRGKNSPNRGNFRGRSGGGNFRGRPTEMHEVICDKCGKKCEVPFKPSRDKPVYCSDCFKKTRGSGSPGISTEQLEELNKKLDKIISLLEKSSK